MENLLKIKIGRVIEGDRQATAWLYDQFAPLLFRRLSSRYVPLGLDGEELLQDAFVFYLQHDARVLRRLLERETTFDDNSVHRYLWDLACGLASNKLRSLKRATIVPLNNEILKAEDDTAQSNLSQDLLSRLDACLSHKNSRVYLYFTLRYVDGLEPEEISRATGWSRKATYKLKQAFNSALADCAERLEINL